MQLIPLNLALVPTATPAKKKPRATAPSQGQLKSNAEQNGFVPLGFADFIEAEFEDVSEELSRNTPQKGYVETLLPYFLFKSRYVNCYV